MRIIQVHRGRVGVVVLTGVVGGRMLELAMRTASNLKAYKRILVCSIHLGQIVVSVLTGEGWASWG